jgi:hypothetical protein
MAIIDIAGFIDMHVHSAPAPFVRIGDSADIARWCAQAGMGGIVIKSHFESTISKVHHARLAVAEWPDFQVFAGIALNRGVGGVNPGAVEIALEQGAKIVWLPTFDAENHARAFGGTGTYGFNSMTLSFRGESRSRGHFTVTRNGGLTEDAKEVIDIVGAYHALLATGHVSKGEIYAIVEYALAKGVKVIVTHPEFTVPDLDIETVVELSQQGIFMEFCAVDCFPIPHAKNLDQMKEMIDAVTPERAVVASDSGQPFSAKPPETLRVFVQCLHEKGMDEASIRRMCIDNPTHLLGLA